VLCVMATMLSRRARLILSARAMSTEVWVIPLISLCVLTTAASAPAVIASTGSSGQKRRCGPQAWSVTKGTPAACAAAATAARSVPRPLYVGEVTKIALAAGCSARARCATSALTVSGMPQSGSTAGSR